MKKSKFKMVAGITAIAMSFALLAGCNPGDDATTGVNSSSTSTETGTDTDTANGDETKEDETPAEEIAEDDVVVTVLDTAVDLAWDKGATVAADKLSSADDTSRFVVTYTSNKDTDYSKFKMALIDCSLELHEGKESNITIDRSSSSTDDLHGCSFKTKPSTTAATFSYQPTADEWKSIKTGGFNIYGHGAKITKIELVTPKDGTAATPTKDNIISASDNVLWTGSADCSWSLGDDSGVALNGNDAIAKLTSDVKGIKVTYTTDDSKEHCLKILNATDWTDITLDSVTGSGELASSGDDAGKAVYLWKSQTDASVSIYWTTEAFEKISGKGLKVYGDGATLTKIEIVTE
ncbi:MAG: hypothetical protein K5786_07875 [Treponema sp.]|nr:hypothetical protein [Treponema sp.]